MLMCRHVLILHVAQGEYFFVQMCLHFRRIEPSLCGYFPSFLSHSYFGELAVLVCAADTLLCPMGVSSWRYKQVSQSSGPLPDAIKVSSAGELLWLGEVSNNFSHFCTEKEV